MEKTDYKKEYEWLKSLLDEAHEAYKKGGRASSRNAEVCRILGFSKGKRPVKIRRQTILSEYRELLASGQDKQQIFDDLMKKHDLTTAALYQHLKLAISEHKKAIVDLYTERGYPFDEKRLWFYNMLPPLK